MKRLPKGLKKVSKNDFVNQVSISFTEANLKSSEIVKNYDDWSEVEEKKQHRQTFRW